MTGGFFNPTETHWIPWSQVGHILPRPPLKVLIMASRSSQDKSEELCDRFLADYHVTICSGIAADPSSCTLQDAIENVRDASPDWIIALGGGSVLDTAKAAAVLANTDGKAVDFLRGVRQIEQPGIPLIAIPTVAGSGSEVTPFASITDTGENKKISLSHDYLYPRLALLDPSLIASVPPKQIAISGLDALSHAIEGYWSKRSTPITESYAIQAVTTVFNSLPNVYLDSGDADARSMLAGLTISNARTTAVHAASYPMTVLFGVPHGLACSMLLPSFIQFNAGSMDSNKEERLVNSLAMRCMDELAAAVAALSHRMDLPGRMEELGIKSEDIATLVRDGFRPDRMANNPRQVTSEDLTCLLKGVL